MAGNYLQRSHVRPALRFILILGLIACGGLLLVSLIWIFHKIHYSLGVDIAEVAMALICILILGLIAAGIRAGLSVDRFIRYRKEAACKLYESSSFARYLLSVLGYAEFPLEKEANTQVDIQNPEEILSLIEKPKRRGRSPTYPLGRWTRVVMAWENRDTVHNPMTLTEFLCEEFGQNADGSPMISENSFYENRKKVIAEIRRRATEKDLPAS